MKPPALRCWTEVDLSAFRHNLSRIRSLLPRGCEIMGVVKANAYGHGLAETSRFLATRGVRIFLVANATEAEALLRAVPRAMALLAGPTVPGEIEWAVRRRGVIFALSDREELQRIERAAARAGATATIHLKVDTGMGRIGCRTEEAVQLFMEVARSHRVCAAGLFSHMARAEADPAECRRQLARLLQPVEELERQGLDVGALHIHNSAAVANLDPNGRLTYARPGLALYGLGEPAAAWRRRLGGEALRPALVWKTRVALIRDVPKGTAISYGGTFRAPRRMRVGVLAAGYADGVSRKLSNLGSVLVGGFRCPILGRVTMDMTMVDLSRVPDARWGDEAVLIGRQGGEEITAREIAEQIGTISYEVLCGIGVRVAREEGSTRSSRSRMRS
ncbi:MAG: alanine racemase [Verrucomicrobiae bacterium]|nr:alanine racemase [Verrucomicrobiae bacterium]